MLEKGRRHKVVGLGMALSIHIKAKQNNRNNMIDPVWQLSKVTI